MTCRLWAFSSYMTKIRLFTSLLTCCYNNSLLSRRLKCNRVQCGDRELRPARREYCTRVRHCVELSAFYEATFRSYRVYDYKTMYVYDGEQPTLCNVRCRNELIRLGFMGDTDNTRRGTERTRCGGRPSDRCSRLQPTVMNSRHYHLIQL